MPMTDSDRTDPEEIRTFRAEINEAERSALRRVDLGLTAMFVAVCVMVLLLAMTLPWIGDSNGLEVLQGEAESPRALPWLFAGVVLAFGVVASTAALLTRRWALVWVSAIGCGYCMLDGVWSIWSRQTSDGAGPRVGMVLAEITVALLFIAWMRFAASRR